MKKFLLFCLIAFFCLAGCDSGWDNSEVGKIIPQAESVTVEKTPDPDAATPASAASSDDGVATQESREPENPPLSSAERRQATDIIDYFNFLNTILAEEPYTLPESCFTAAHEYLQAWRLKPAPKSVKNTETAQRLAPPPKLFDEETRGQLLRHIGDMNGALDEVLKEYRRLEKYAKDGSIVDDGVMGKKIIAALDTAHQKFLTTRNDFLKPVEDASVHAEDGLLQDHPLKRQIRHGREIFSLFRRTALLLSEEIPDKTTLVQVCDKLKNVLDDAGKPPFRAPPAVEREYRAFLKEAARFAEALSQGLAGNFQAAARQSLNDATTASRRAYNDFARVANN